MSSEPGARVSDAQAHQYSREDFTALPSSFGPALADCAADLLDARAKLAAWEPVVRAAAAQEQQHREPHGRTVRMGAGCECDCCTSARALPEVANAVSLLAPSLAALLAETEAAAAKRMRERAAQACEAEEQAALEARNGEAINDAVQDGSWGAARRIAAAIRALEVGEP